MAYKNGRLNLQVVEQAHNGIGLRFKAGIGVRGTRGLTATGAINADNTVVLGQGCGKAVGEVVQIPR